jgi:hypothetical protein
MEQGEKIELKDRSLIGGEAVRSFKNYSQSFLSVQKRQQNQHSIDKLSHSPTSTKVIDVFGEEGEPICDYLRCNHRFSVHGLGTTVCQCRHPRNTAIGV